LQKGKDRKALSFLATFSAAILQFCNPAAEVSPYPTLVHAGGPVSGCLLATLCSLASAGSEWLVVTTQVDDPRYLNQPYLASTHFKREPDGARWAPSPCEKK